MACVDYAKFQLVTDLGETQFLTELENNLKNYLDWSFLCVGGWTDITIPTVDGYGGVSQNLRYVKDESYTDGQVWQAARKEWVWETGVNFTSGGADRNPINIDVSGVTVNGTPQTSGYHINYPLGRIIFDTALPTGTSAVTLDYSYKTVQSYVADDVPWWRELQYNSWKAHDIHFTQNPRDGNWSIGGHHRVQMPCVVVEAVSRGRSSGYELGNRALEVEQDVLFHVLADNRTMRNKVTSMLQMQQGNTIWLFDSDAVAAATGFPLDYRGERVGTNMYPDLVNPTNGFRWKKCHFQDVVLSEVDIVHQNLYQATVRFTCQVVIGSI
jgi:hypothetical protein